MTHKEAERLWHTQDKWFNAVYWRAGGMDYDPDTDRFYLNRTKRDHVNLRYQKRQGYVGLCDKKPNRAERRRWERIANAEQES